VIAVERASRPATITVRGEAAVRTEPDEGVLWITLSAFEESPGQALGDVATRSEALVALLDELGVAEADRSTAGVSVRQDFDPPSSAVAGSVIAPGREWRSRSRSRARGGRRRA
jgi:uncharacterized protein YggE